jgi:peptide chain release factor 2
LKGTVERLVLLPLATRIVSGSVQNGSVVRLVPRGDRVGVEVIPPEAGEDESPIERRSDSRDAEATRAADLRERLDGLKEKIRSFGARMSALLGRTAEPGFHDDANGARKILDEIHLLDGVLTQAESLDKDLRDVEELLAKRRTGDRQSRIEHELLDRLGAELDRLLLVADSPDPRNAADALITITHLSSKGDPLGGVESLARMYVGFARRRHLEVAVLDDRKGGDPPEDTVSLLVSGAGAHALLAREDGIHEFNRQRAQGTGGREKPRSAEIIRVDVMPAPEDDGGLREEDLKVSVKVLKKLPGRLVPKLKTEIRLVHKKTMLAVRGWTDAEQRQGVERLKLLLAALVERQASGGGRSEMPSKVRVYTLGPSQLVRDNRTGVKTGKLERVLDGELEILSRTAALPADR